MRQWNYQEEVEKIEKYKKLKIEIEKEQLKKIKLENQILRTILKSLKKNK